MYLCDYHIHTRISPDSQTLAADMVKRACELQFSEIALTDHFDVSNQTLPGYEDYRFDGALMAQELYNVREMYGDKIKIRFGIELGQPHHIPEMAEALMQRFDFDFVISSLHNRKDSDDYYFMDFSKVDPKQELDKFFEDMLLMAAYHDYDVIGHLPYPMRYIAKAFGDCDLLPFREVIAQILKVIIKNGKGIEINTSTLRQGMDFTMPPLWIAKLYRELGGEVLTVGSDAHSESHLGFHIKEIRRELHGLGFKYLATYEQRKPKFVKMI